jgi:hypothetical protein
MEQPKITPEAETSKIPSDRRNLEKWGEKETFRKQRDLRFLTKVIFWGFLIFLIGSIVLLILGQLINMTTLIVFGSILLILTELTRKFYQTEGKKGIKSTTLTSILVGFAILNIILLFIIKDREVLGFTFILLSLSSLLFFKKLEE